MLTDAGAEPQQRELARQRYEEAQPLYRQVGDVLGQANCIQSLGDLALQAGEKSAARARWTEALSLYERIAEPYSIGWTHRRLARVAKTRPERDRHVAAARNAWTSINRPDLGGQLDREFPPGADTAD